ncbi:MAG: hypothetical protein ACR2KK_10070 [Acidimicrobiales bacterium]
MRRLWECVAAVPILLLATACNEPIPGAEKTLAAAEVAPAEPLDSTTTTSAVTAVPAPTVAPSTTVKRRAG